MGEGKRGRGRGIMSNPNLGRCPERQPSVNRASNNYKCQSSIWNGATPSFPSILFFRTHLTKMEDSMVQDRGRPQYLSFSGIFFPPWSAPSSVHLCSQFYPLSIYLTYPFLSSQRWDDARGPHPSSANTSRPSYPCCRRPRGRRASRRCMSRSMSHS